MTATDEQLQESIGEQAEDARLSSPSSVTTKPPDVPPPTSTLTPDAPELTSNAPLSTPIHTPSTQPTPTTQNHDDNPSTDLPADPNVAALLGIFPDFDVSLLQSVLQSVSGDQERAIDVLLGMNDPEYRPISRPDITQTQLDEEMARRLMLEETEQQQRTWQPQDPSLNVPYQSRSYPTASQQAYHNSQQRPAESDSMAQFQEQLGKFAETGKRTFNTLFSKVKAKIQEFDSPSGQEQSAHSLPRGDSWNTPAQALSYYDPNPPQSTEGYDMTRAEPSPHGTLMSHDAATTAGQSANASQLAPSSTAAAPTGIIDPSKIGLLPKQPVSLGSSPQPSKNLEDDDVEYVENPFEESTRR